MSEARLQAAVREEAAQASKPLSASMKLALGFKKASPRVQKIGKARIFMEDAVKRAERKLLGLKRTKEITAKLSWSRPGQFLKEEELAKIYEESGCTHERNWTSAARNCYKPAQIRYRTADGTCNNLVNVTDGASETEFRRIAPPHYEDGISSPLGTTQFLSYPNQKVNTKQVATLGPYGPPHPSPRLISLNIVEDRDDYESRLAYILMQWGQFVDHDMDLAPEPDIECEGCDLTAVCHNIRIPNDDPTFGMGTYRNGNCLPFRRSVASCMNNRPGSFEPRQQINTLTSFIDGSGVYGSTVQVQNMLRLFRDGLLRTGPPPPSGQKDILPTIQDLLADGVKNAENIVQCPTPNTKDCFACGDERCNEQTALTVMHTIWMREHNRLAAELQLLNPHWTDERLFQEARAVVGAEIQRITYSEYLPVILGRTVFDKVIKKYNRYNPVVDPSVPNSFATAAYRFGHSLVQPYFARLDANYSSLPIGPLYLTDAFFNPPSFQASGGTDPILRGLVSTMPRSVNEGLTYQLTNQLFEMSSKNGSGMDLASLNINRARDHGIPSYATFKRLCHSTFPNLGNANMENELTYIRLVETYGSLKPVDLWVGGLAEERLEGSLLGPTFACLLGLTFANVRDGDRFYFESKSGSLTSEQRSAIRQTSLSRVLCDNGDNITTIQPKAFLVRQERTQCGNISSLDLEPWREKVRYFRLSIANPHLLVSSYSFSKNQPQAISINSNEQNSVCLPFSCPTDKNIIIFVAPKLSLEARKKCIVTPSGALDIHISETFFYKITYCPANIPTDRNGVYDSLDACLNGSVSAFTFDQSCQPPAQAQSELDTSQSVEESNSINDYPQELEDILKQAIEDKEMAQKNKDDEGSNSKKVDDEVEGYTSNSQPNSLQELDDNVETVE